MSEQTIELTEKERIIGKITDFLKTRESVDLDDNQFLLGFVAHLQSGAKTDFNDTIEIGSHRKEKQVDKAYAVRGDAEKILQEIFNDEESYKTEHSHLHGTDTFKIWIKAIA